MGGYAVILEDVTFTYSGSEKAAIRDVDLRISRGEVVAVMGRTGAGKSTTIYAIGGIIPNYIQGRLEGDVLVDGLNTKEHSLHELARHVGVVMDDPEAHIVSFTVEEDVAFGPCNLGLSREEVLKRVEMALDATRLSRLRHRNPYNLSGGEKQSLAIAGVLSLRPSILALDEPMSMLDPLGRARVCEVLRTLNKAYGITVVFTDHDAERAIGLADRIVVLNEGQITLNGAPSKVLQETEILEKCGVRLPEVTKLASLLEREKMWSGPLPLTLEEALIQLTQRLRKRERGTGQYSSAVEKMPEESAAEPIISIRKLDYTYPNGVTALKDINLDIYPGEYVALIGQNGSGKSTLARCIAGLIKPSNKDAEITVAGLDMKKARMQDIVRKVGYVFQIPEHQIFHLATEEELEFGLRNLGLPEEEIKRRVKRLLRKLELEEYKDEWPLSLDRGKRFRIALGSVLALEPEIIIVDEPTTGQDWRDSIYICEFLKRLNREGRTIIIITHEMDLVARFASRVIVLYEGQILLDGNPREVFSKPELLKKTWVTPPKMAQLSWRLRDRLGILCIALNVEEVYEILVQAMSRR